MKIRKGNFIQKISIYKYFFFQAEGLGKNIIDFFPMLRPFLKHKLKGSYVRFITSAENTQSSY